jgi:hypothetical protein
MCVHWENSFWSPHQINVHLLQIYAYF